MASKTEKNKIGWMYLYSEGCGPCLKTTPIIDAFIASGMKVDKVSIQDAAPQLRRGTPSLFRYDKQTMQMVGHNYGGEFWGSYMALYKGAKFLFKDDISSPIECMAEMLKSTEEPNIEKFMK